MEIEDVKQNYRDQKDEIKSRIKQFQQLQDTSDYRLFKELVFVILTSRSDAKKSWEAVEKLDELGLMENGSKEEIAEVLKSYDIQYERNKASYIVDNRRSLSQPTLEDPSDDLKLSQRIDPHNLDATREQLVKNLKGISWKGASHFLRNIGYGNEFAIVSGYIAKKLYQLGMLDSPDPPKNKEEYLEAEQKLRQLSKETGIDIQELDLVLWSMETGEVFK